MSIIITKDEFMSRKNSYIRQENILSKYEKLITGYECFTKVTYFHKSKVFDKGGRKQYTNHEKKHSNTKRSFTSLWNLLNESNYTKICHRLKFMISDENVHIVMKELVTMAIMHSIYRKYFILILKDVIKTYNTHQLLHDIIMAFDDKYLILPSITLDAKENYDMFCATMKHKQKVLNTYMFLLDVIDNISVSIVELIERTSNIFAEHIKNEYYFDLLVHIMIIIAERYPKEVSAKVNSLRDVFAATCSDSKKSKFLVEKIIMITQTVQ
jgi:hypothetical protein